jgi:hypothetical protein
MKLSILVPDFAFINISTISMRCLFFRIARFIFLKSMYTFNLPFFLIFTVC